MKALRLFACALGLAAASALPAADAPGTPSRVSVTFDHPENFTDVKDSSLPSDAGRDALLGALERYIVRQGDGLLPAGYTLQMTFTDVDLAGEFEPWRGPRFQDVRIVKDMYPPRFVFTYVVHDASGKAVKQGSEDIRDLTFLYRLTPSDSDNLRYEKALLNDWIHATVRTLAKA